MTRLLRIATLATLGAGLVGAWRQRQEAQLARRTGASPPRPAGGAGGEFGALGQRLATWTPTRPASPAGRVAAAVWAAPLSLLGLALGLMSGGTPRWDDALGCIVFEGSAGVSGRALELVGAKANAIGQVVVVRSERAPARLLAHEAVHVRQAERLGPLLFPLYLWLAARYGYANHPLERAARIAAER